MHNANLRNSAVAFESPLCINGRMEFRYAVGAGRRLRRDAALGVQGCWAGARASGSRSQETSKNLRQSCFAISKVSSLEILAPTISMQNLASTLARLFKKGDAFEMCGSGR